MKPNETIPLLEYDKDEDFHIEFERSRTLRSNSVTKWAVFRELAGLFSEESFYLLNEKELQKRAEIFLSDFQKNKRNRFAGYAIKSNPHPRVIEILRDTGITSFDCASVSEIIRVQKIFKEASSVKPNIFYNHPVKDRSSIEQALKREVTHFTVDLLPEVKKIFRLLKKEDHIEIIVRMVPKTENESQAKLQLFDKFCTDTHTGNKILEYTFSEAHKKGLSVDLGISMHIGSQNFSPAIHSEHAKKLVADISNNAANIRAFNFGGGVPVDPRKGVRANERILRNYLRILDEVTEKTIDPLVGENGKIIIEPGRGMVCTCVDLMIPILDIRKQGSKNYLYINDGVFSSFSDSAIHNWKFPFRVITKEGKYVSGLTTKFTLIGRTGESGDHISDVTLPSSVSTDHYLWVPNAGAYHSTQGAFSFQGRHTHRYVTYNLI